MTFTLEKRLLYFFITLLVKSIWLFDWWAYFLSKNFALKFLLRTVVITSLIFAFFYPFFHYHKEFSLINQGIVVTIYGDLSSTPSSELKSYVLGSVAPSRAQPVLKKKIVFPDISSKSYLVVDNNSRKIITQQKYEQRLAPASTTKLMTALVALDLYDLEDTLEIKSECLKIDSTKLWLPEGAEFTVKDLLYSLLVSSAGDAGCTLAISESSQEEFVTRMNAKAKLIGMNNTNFTNPIGLDGANGSHYSTAWDLYLLSLKAMQDQVLKSIVAEKSYSFKAIDEKFDITITNTNKLLWDIPNTVGIKTGTTTDAGEVLIYEYADDQKDITIVVMGSTDRFSDITDLLNWTLTSYSWK